MAPELVTVSTDYAKLRQDMVEQYIAARGGRSGSVLTAMRNVPREAFVPGNLREFVYEDPPLPIAEGQTISQPYIVAFMVEALALEGGERVLEIGAGSGYAAAVLSEIAADVYTVERIAQRAEKAAALLADRGYANVHLLHGDGASFASAIVSDKLQIERPAQLSPAVHARARPARVVHLHLQGHAVEASAPDPGICGDGAYCATGGSEDIVDAGGGVDPADVQRLPL